MIRGLVTLLLVATFATGCSDDEDGTAGVTTTSNPDRPASTTTTDGVSVTIVPATDATDEEILAGVAAGSIEGAALLPDDRWTAGVRRGCADLGDVADDEIGDFFELFRIQVEDSGGSRAQSLEAVRALVGGLVAACPDLGQRLRPLVPVS